MPSVTTAKFFKFSALSAILILLSGLLSPSFADDAKICVEGTADLNAKLAACNRALWADPKSAQNYVARGASYKIRGFATGVVGEDQRSDIDLALRDFNKAIEIDPMYYQAYVERGLYYQLIGKNDLAIKDYDKALELKPQLKTLREQRNLLQLETGEKGEALGDLQKMVDDAKDPDIRASRLMAFAKGLAANGDKKGALAKLDEAVLIRPDDPIVLRAHGDLLEEDGQTRRALDEYSKAASLDESVKVDNPNKEEFARHATKIHLWVRGRELVDAGQYERAIAILSLQIKLYPEEQNGYDERIRAFESRGQFDLADRDFEKLTALEKTSSYCVDAEKMAIDKKFDLAIRRLTNCMQSNPAHSYWPVIRAMSYASQGNFTAATADYDLALKLGPGRLGIYLARARCYYSLGLFEKAISDFDAAEKNSLLDPQGFYLRGMSHIRTKSLVRAKSDFDKAISLDGRQADAYFRRGSVLEMQKRYDDALADVAKAIELDNSNPYYLNLRAWIYFKKQQGAKGLADVEKALTIRPTDALILDTRGHILEQLGRMDEAIASFKSALEQSPTQAESIAALKRLGAMP